MKAYPRILGTQRLSITDLNAISGITPVVQAIQGITTTLIANTAPGLIFCRATYKPSELEGGGIPSAIIPTNFDVVEGSSGYLTNPNLGYSNWVVAWPATKAFTIGPWSTNIQDSNGDIVINWNINNAEVETVMELEVFRIRE